MMRVPVVPAKDLSIAMGSFNTISGCRHAGRRALLDQIVSPDPSLIGDGPVYLALSSHGCAHFLR
jgi:hypothetical protein